MYAIGKLLLAATIISVLLNGLIFLGTVIALLKQWVGPLAYILWVVAAPLLSPAALGLPWFVSWVDGESVSERVVWIWLSFYVCMGLRALSWKWAPDR